MTLRKDYSKYRKLEADRQELVDKLAGIGMLTRNP